MSRCRTWLAVAALLALAAGAQAAPTDTDADESRPFIERSLLLVPEQVGALQLGDVHVYERSVDGVGYRYHHPEFPGVRIDLFVYPRGRAARDEALDQGMRELRDSIDYAASQGGYTDLEYGASGSIDLDRIDVDGSTLPPEASDGSSPRAHGRRLALRLSIAGDPLDSRAYLFYDALYMIKGRISASPQELPGELLDRFADRVMADLVPAVGIRNTGGCAQHTLVVDPDAADGDTAIAAQLAPLLERMGSEACDTKLDESVPAGQRATLLEIDPSLWRND